MNEYKNTKFVKSESELPKFGELCSCGGKIVKSKYGGMWCVSCKNKWKVSQYDVSPNNVIPTNWQKVEGEKILADEIRALNDRLDKASKYIMGIEARIDKLENK